MHMKHVPCDGLPLLAEEAEGAEAGAAGGAGAGASS
jgi:hypothetical protein